jgi:CRISPR/Cas system endoribonuclease Cas6 (RAMP superfamily)
MGESHVKREAFSYDHRGTAFMIQHVAVVTGLWPNASGLLGGARLTVFGDGFSANAAAMRVEVAGAPCPILTTAPNQLVCELPPNR